MKTNINYDNEYGNLLWLTDGKTEVTVALDYGLRIVVLRCVGMENILYQQPADLSDGLTAEKVGGFTGDTVFGLRPKATIHTTPIMTL